MALEIDAQRTVADLVTELPARARVFERYSIDYCCGGKKPLTQAATERGVVTQTLLSELSNIQPTDDQEAIDWSQRSMTELADHIESTHHAYLRTELPRLAMLVDKVAAVHGAAHPWMLEVRRVYGQLATELDSHSMKEEQVLFPICRALETEGADPAPPGGSVENPVRAMEHEHDEVAVALGKLRNLTSGYQPPEGACNTFRVMLASLNELESDLHRHIHKENNILFPRAVAADAERQKV